MTRRRVVQLVALPVAVLAGVLWWLGSRARDEAPLDLRVGAQSSSVREIDLTFHTRPGDARVLDVELRFPSGAPADVYRTAHLRDGDYTASARLVTDSGQRVVEKQVHVEREHPTVIDLE